MAKPSQLKSCHSLGVVARVASLEQTRATDFRSWKGRRAKIRWTSSVGKSSRPMLLAGWTALYFLRFLCSDFYVFFPFPCTCLLTVLASVSADYCGGYTNFRAVDPTHTLLHTGYLKFEPFSLKHSCFPRKSFVRLMFWFKFWQILRQCLLTIVAVKSQLPLRETQGVDPTQTTSAQVINLNIRTRFCWKLSISHSPLSKFTHVLTPLLIFPPPSLLPR